MFDVEKAQTYEDAIGMIEEFNAFRGSNAVTMLLANKCSFLVDFLDDSSRTSIDLESVEDYCLNHHIIFEKISAVKRPNELERIFLEFLHGNFWV